MRADRLMVARGLAASRTLAQRLIAARAVRAVVNGREFTLERASHELPDAAALAVTAGQAETRYVSRGGLKLEAALARTGVEPRGKVALDVGLSTGGFTDCLLQHGAARVVGVDVGHGQLATRLATDPRVLGIEGVNARALTPAVFGAAMPPAGFELAVIDVSFISLEKVLPAVVALLAPAGELLALVKPQFEVGPRGLGRGGIVSDGALIPGVRRRLLAAGAGCGLACVDWFDSPITGGDGNREYFMHLRHRHDRAAVDLPNAFDRPHPGPPA